MALTDMIKGYDVSIVGTMEEISGEHFEIIKKAAVDIFEQTGLKVIVTCFHANYHQKVEVPVSHNGKIIGYEIHQDGEVVGLRGVDEPNNEIY
jgi:uncharacterized protein YuzE